MAKLNEKTISEFVDSMMPAKEEGNHEFTANGTVASVDNNGVAVVYLDGGDANGTPCQTTVGCSAGDRVIVSFKNREPVVTSNISKPVATLEEVNAKVVNAVTIFAENGTFSGTLSAATGTFAGSLSAATGTFSGTLSAATGTFAGNLSAAGGTFKGTLSAAGGTFGGTLSVSANTSQGTITVTICSRDAQSRVAVPIRISEKYTGQSNTEYRTTIGGDGALLQQITSNTDVAHTDLGYGGVTVWANGVGTTSMTPLGVSGPNSSRLISSGEISKLNNYPASPPDKWNNSVSWTSRSDRYTHNLNAGSYYWYVLTKPTDTNYNWYLINAVGDENAFWILHTSQTGAYVYNHGSDNWASIQLTGYWLGIHK